MSIIFLDNKFQRFRYYFWENGKEDERVCASFTMVIFAATVFCCHASLVHYKNVTQDVTQCVTQHVTRCLFRYDDKECYAQRRTRQYTFLATVC